jgi:hypothetical protein
MKWLALMFSALAAYITIPASAETLGPTCTDCPAGSECAVVFAPPHEAEQSVLVASNSLTIGAGTTVKAERNTDGAIANSGRAGTTIGARASVGGLYSNANVILGANARVNGPLKTGGRLTTGPGATVKGPVSTNTLIHPDPKVLAIVTFTDDAPALTVANGATRRLDPGRYGATLVGAGGTLSLSAGTYYMASLTVGQDATLNLDETLGPVIVYVQTTFVFDGIERETGGEGHVLVAIFGCGTDAVAAPFRGTILAPSASLVLGPDGVQSFSGKFFAESITVGARNSVIGLGITVPPAPPSSIPPQTPRPLPAPPVSSETGCFQYTLNGWESIPCATDDFINRNFPHPDAQLTVTSSAAPSLVYGQLAVTIPAVASEQDASFGSNKFSIQNNTNQWTVPSTAASGAGDIAATQFTMQSLGSTTAICIWNVDVTKNTPADYHKTCVTPPPQQRSGGLQPFDFGNLAASITADGKLALVGQLSWVPPGQPNIYLVKTDDMFGLASNWTQVSGGLLGLGSGSQAQLTNAQVVTEIAASTCPGDTDAPSPTCPPPTLQPNAGAFIGGTGTVETSNLQPVGMPTVVFPNADLAVSSLISSTTGNCVGAGLAYVKDNDADFGATPSNLGEQVFWESPDIFLVPHGTPVDLNSVSTETLLAPGGSYDIFVRVHNDLGCNAVDNIRTLVYLADPAALSIQWNPITGGNYVGNNGGSTGVTAPAGGAALIGPIPFTAPSTGLGNAHKCILAAIQADGEPPPSSTFDAPASNQVAQRNVQFAGPCVFPLTNGTASTGAVSITVSATPNTGPAPSLTALPLVQVAFDDFDSSWFNVWNAQPENGSAYKATHSGSTTTVRLASYSVTLNQVQLAAGQTRNATGTTVLPSGYPNIVTLQIGASLSERGQTVANGGSCVTPPPPVIK